MGNKLTDEQRKLIEDNHNIIYSYMHTNHIDMDYYGAFAEKLCNAIHYYDPTKSQLITFVYNVFDNYWRNILKYKYSQCRYIPASKRIFMDSTIDYTNGDTTSVEELIGEEDMEYTRVEDADLINKIRQKLKIRYPQDTITDSVIEYILKGYNCREVGDIYGVSRQAINARVQKIKKIYEEIKEECE